jgi:uncharacterized protein (DUF362 family)
MRRRKFIQNLGIIGGIAPLFFSWKKSLLAQNTKVKVYKVINSDCFQNTAKICEMLNLSNYIDPSDVVVIKGNAQWPYQGYTHTGVIKGVIDKILEIPEFSGEIFICDNVQVYASEGNTAFDVPVDKRTHNWPDHNWSTLAEEYQANGKPVAVKNWINSSHDISSPANGEGWIRDYFTFHDLNTYLSYPIFESPLTTGRMIDMKNGVWENGEYTGRKVKAIFMPTLNNHGIETEDYAGITSAIKSFFGTTEIHRGATRTFKEHANIHGSSFSRLRADYAGELAARYIHTLYQPVLYITAAIWSGHHSRTGDAVETKAVLACENPATLDYIAARDIISPHAEFLNPDQDNNTRKQILGCINGNVGTIDPAEYEVITYDFDNLSGIDNHTEGIIPGEHILHQNYPNPFNASTNIEFVLTNSEHVLIEVFNIRGQKVEILLNKSINAGQHLVRFKAQNLPSGNYFYKIKAGKFEDVKKMILLK